MLMAALEPVPATAAPGPAAAMVLRIPCFLDHRERFYLRLLSASLAAIHQPARIDCVNDLPGRRMWALMGEDQLDLIWGMQTPDKDRLLLPIEVDLTDGLAGQRILLIRPQSQRLFDRVTSIDSLRALNMVAGFGEGWFDAAVWKANRLQLVEFPGQFALMFPMVASGARGIDYLPRGGNEIVAEAAAYNSLVIEQHLLFYYERDMRFYLSPRAARHRQVLESALRAAEASGLKRRLIEQAFGADIKALGLAHRRRIRLASPPQEAARRPQLPR